MHSCLTKVNKNIAIEELAEKIRLENVLRRELQPLFNIMNRDFATTYRATGRIMDFSRYKSDIAAVLRKHYTRVQKSFSGQVAKQNSKIFSQLYFKQQEEKELIDLGLLNWQIQQLETQPEAIIETTDKDARRAIVQAQRQAVDNGEDVSNLTAIALAAAVINRRALFGRMSGIVITETQTAAESTKQIEAEALTGRMPYTVQRDPFQLTRPRDIPLRDGTKQWVTVADDRVRPSHASADRQVVDIDRAFNVGGFAMRHPADMSMGAPIREWIGCRCSSNVQIEGF